MVVQIRHHRIEAHSAEQLVQVGFRFRTHAPDFICKQDVRPVPPSYRVIVTLQQGQRADHAVAPVTVFYPVAVKPAHEQNLPPANRCDVAVSRAEATGFGKLQQAVLHAGMVPAIIMSGELGDP